MDDMVAESKFATPREVLTPLFNLSSGDQRSAQARHVAPKSPFWGSGNQSPKTNAAQAKNHDPFNI